MRAIAAATVLTVAALLPLQPAAAVASTDASCGFCWLPGISPEPGPEG